VRGGPPPGIFARAKRAKASKFAREARKKIVRSLLRLADHLDLMCPRFVTYSTYTGVRKTQKTDCVEIIEF
jgi:hypothetical protein